MVGLLESSKRDICYWQKDFEDIIYINYVDRIVQLSRDMQIVAIDTLQSYLVTFHDHPKDAWDALRKHFEH